VSNSEPVCFDLGETECDDVESVIIDKQPRMVQEEQERTLFAADNMSLASLNTNSTHSSNDSLADVDTNLATE